MEMVLYHSDEGDVCVDAYIMDESLWITQKAMAELFGVQVPAISKHLKKIFEEGELDEKVVVSKMEITSPHGAIPGKTQSGEAMFYNLDAIISVGYRVNSKKDTRFRTISRPTAYGEYAPFTLWIRVMEMRAGKVLETERPICVAADGLPVMDDVGGIRGYCELLKVVKGKEESEVSAFESKEDAKDWARMMGWTGRMSKAENIL